MFAGAFACLHVCTLVWCVSVFAFCVWEGKEAGIKEGQEAVGRQGKNVGSTYQWVELVKLQSAVLVCRDILQGDD